MKKRRAVKKRKKVAYRFIPLESDRGQVLYPLLRELVAAHHREIIDAKIALCWNLNWQPDVDGRVILGQCREVFELEGFDFVIVLHFGFWSDLLTTDQQRRALLDHELCHATVQLDERGEPKVDERNRVVYRIRRHDLEEFSEIAERHGCWKRDIEGFARALDRARHKVKNKWVGYDRLQGQLKEAGLVLSLDAIVGWTETERREATVWAEVQTGRGTELRLDLLPPFLAAAAGAVAPPPASTAAEELFPSVPPAPGEPVQLQTPSA
jgi:hypothetical protein